MQVKAQRERRSDKCNKFYRQYKIFQMDAKKFHIEIGKNQVMIKETLPKDSTDRTYLHLEQNNLFPLEQKGCRHG